MCEMNLITAINLDNDIGIENKNGTLSIPWYVPEDLQYFKQLTLNNIVIMGRKTFETLKNKPLAERINIVITRNPETYDTETDINNLSKENKLIFCTFENFDCIAIQLKKLYSDKEFFVIGGAEIYSLFWNKCTKFYITKVYIHSPTLGKPIKLPYTMDEIMQQTSTIITINAGNQSVVGIYYKIVTFI